MKGEELRDSRERGRGGETTALPGVPVKPVSPLLLEPCSLNPVMPPSVLLLLLDRLGLGVEFLTKALQASNLQKSLGG